MALSGKAVIVGTTEYPASRYSVKDVRSSLEIAADLALLALDDAGLSLRNVNGIAVNAIYETNAFLPVTLAEYLGIQLSYADVPDFGGASSAAMVGRAAFAIENGLADVVLCIVPGLYPPQTGPDTMNWRVLGGSSYNEGSPQAEFEIPFAHLGQNALYAMIAQRYAYEYGYNASAIARLVVQTRFNGAANPSAIFFNEPVSEEQVLASPMIASPLRMLEMVRPVRGGAAVVVASEAIARRCSQVPAHIVGYGEQVGNKHPAYRIDMLDPPLRTSARAAFSMAGLAPSLIDSAQIYDCYTINVIMALEASGFCEQGEGLKFVLERNLTYRGDFPLNTNGGQLGFGQAGNAGGMTHVIEATRQVTRRAGHRQVQRSRTAFIVGNGGIMGEQVALILRGAD